MPELTQTVEPSLEATLAPLLETRAVLKQNEKTIAQALEAVNDDIKTALVQAGVFEITVDGHRAVLDMERQKSTLDKTKLLEQGVTTDQIKAATKVSTHIQLDVYKAKAE